MKLPPYPDTAPSVAHNAAKLAGLVVLSLAAIRLCGRAFLYLLPFVLALGLATMLERPVAFLRRKLHIRRSVSSTLFLLLIAFLLGALFVLLAMRLYVETKAVVVQLPQIYNDLTTRIEEFFEHIETEYEWITPEVMAEIRSVFTRLRGSLVTLVNRVSRGVWNTAINVPHVFIGCVMTFFAAFYFLRDREGIRAWFDRQLPDRWKSSMAHVRREMLDSLLAYLRAILILALIAFVEMFIGFSVLRLEYAAVLAFFCAVLDALPAIGPGWVLTPWGIALLLMGNYRLGVSILLLYAVTWVIRQILEPRIVGDQVGIYPVVLLIAMFLGLQLYGVIGLLLGPITAILLRNILRLYFAGRTLDEVLHAGVPEPETPEAAGSDPPPSESTD